MDIYYLYFQRYSCKTFTVIPQFSFKMNYFMSEKYKHFLIYLRYFFFNVSLHVKVNALMQWFKSNARNSRSAAPDSYL